MSRKILKALGNRLESSTEVAISKDSIIIAENKTIIEFFESDAGKTAVEDKLKLDIKIKQEMSKAKAIEIITDNFKEIAKLDKDIQDKISDVFA